jgi:hypothetical protein
MVPVEHHHLDPHILETRVNPATVAGSVVRRA